MNKCYFGNFQDFCKYGLLRELAAFAKARNIGMHFCQMVTPERKGSGGKANYEYLDSPARYRPLAPELFDDLKEWHNTFASGDADDWLQKSEHLLRGVIPHNEEIPACDSARAEYFQRMHHAFGCGNIVFFNPDYGLEFAARLIREGDSRRYIGAEEIRQCIDAGNSVLFYQEMLAPQKQKARDNLWRDVLQNLRNADINNRVFFFSSSAPSYTAGKKTAESGYFLVAHKDHKAASDNFATAFLQTDWCKAGDPPPLFNITRRIGVFADADNFNARHIPYALRKIKEEVPGEIRHKVAFGQAQSIAPMIEGAMGFITRKVGMHEDAADLGLSFEVAKMICQSQIDIAIVLSGDGGFVATAKQAQKMGVSYIGVGLCNAPTEYRQECERFYEVGKNRQGNYTWTPKKKKS